MFLITEEYLTKCEAGFRETLAKGEVSLVRLQIVDGNTITVPVTQDTLEEFLIDFRTKFKALSEPKLRRNKGSTKNRVK